MTARRRQHGNILHFRPRELVRLFRSRLGDGPGRLELNEAIVDAVGGDPMGMTAKEVGERVNLTLVERSQLNIRTITAVDATPDEVREHYRTKKLERDRLAARRRRQRKPAALIINKIPHRMAKVQDELSQYARMAGANHWVTIEEMILAVEKSRAFSGLKGKSLRARVHECLDRLAKTNVIEEDMAVGKGGFSVQLIRLRTTTANVIRFASATPAPRSPEGTA